MKDLCTKKQFKSESHAQIAIEVLNKANKNLRLTYAYECKICGFWHMTSERFDSKKNSSKINEKENSELHKIIKQLRTEKHQLVDKIIQLEIEISTLKTDLSKEKDRVKSHKDAIKRLKDGEFGEGLIDFNKEKY